MAESPRARELFDPDFLASLQRLQILATRVARGGAPAEQRSKDLGSGIEFRDYRPYSAGDDFRAIDWNIYRRLGRVVLRLFEELEDLPVYVLPDVSDSAFFETPPRADAGLRVAMAFAAIALAQHDRVGLYPFGSELGCALRPRSGKRELWRFAEELAALKPSGGTDFARSLARFESMGLRRGLVVLISDFFDPAGLDALGAVLRRQRHRLVLVQLSRESDRHPKLEGDLRVEDCESGEGADVSIGAALLERYRAAYDRFNEGLVEVARNQGAGLLRLDVEAPVLPQLETLFARGSLVV